MSSENIGEKNNAECGIQNAEKNAEDKLQNGKNMKHKEGEKLRKFVNILKGAFLKWEKLPQSNWKIDWEGMYGIKNE